MPPAYRFALCNELFQDAPLADVSRQVKHLGYDGLEIAPFTLSDDPAALTAGQRAEIRASISDAGLEFVGLHWLLAAPAGLLQVSSNNPATHSQSWEYVTRLIDLCADLANPAARQRPVVVFGSPKQRSSASGSSPQEATKLFTEGLSRVAPHAASRAVTLLVEALSPSQTDVVTSLAEAVSIVEQIANPAVETMFDVHNAIDETEPHDTLVGRYFRHIKHVHVNELDGREPGMGDYDFLNLLAKLADINYAGWVSLEAFDFSRNPRDVAARAIETLRAAQSARQPIKTI